MRCHFEQETGTHWLQRAQEVLEVRLRVEEVPVHARGAEELHGAAYVSVQLVQMSSHV